MNGYIHDSQLTGILIFEPFFSLEYGLNSFKHVTCSKGGFLVTFLYRKKVPGTVLQRCGLTTVIKNTYPKRSILSKAKLDNMTTVPIIKTFRLI